MSSLNNENPEKPVLVAIVANTIIAISKGIGYLFSGSSALLSETIHSIADVMNQALLLIGIRRGARPENEIYNYGYSQERFFWNLLSAVGIFVLGCGVTLYHGVHELLEHSDVKPAGVEQYVIEAILLISLLAEGYSFSVAVKEIKKSADERKKKFFTYLNESTDPSISAIFWEDLAAILGILLAFTGIVMTNLTMNKTFDSIASILIALLMGWIAYHLAIENKKFLVDRSIPDFEMNLIKEILNNNPYLKGYSEIKSIVLGPTRLKFTAKLDFQTEKLFKTTSFSKKFEENPQLTLNLNDAKILNDELFEVQKRIINEIKSEMMNKIPNLMHIELTI